MISSNIRLDNGILMSNVPSLFKQDVIEIIVISLYKKKKLFQYEVAK